MAIPDTAPSAGVTPWHAERVPRQVALKLPDAGPMDLGAGAWVELHPGFVDDRMVCMEELAATLPLRVEWLRLFGRRQVTPRRTSWHGEPWARYAYSGRVFEPAPWTDGLAALRDRLLVRTGVRFTGVLANEYRDGRDSMGWHADDEPELGPEPHDVRVASISLGARRRFVLRSRAERTRRVEFELGYGDLLVMGGTTQQHFEHAVPKTAKPVGPRLNLTFRVVLPPPDVSVR